MNVDQAKAFTPPSSAVAQARLAAIVASSDDAIVGKDLNGIIESWNAGAQRMFGYSAEDAIGRPVMMLIPPGREDEENEILHRLRQGERVDHFETVRRHKSGRLIEVSVTISPIHDAEGKIVGASKIARDISSYKQFMREREDLLLREQSARQQAEKANRAKDEFLATLSHELRTPLNAILGWAQMLRAGSTTPDEVSRGIATIERNARAQAQLIDDLMDVSRIISGKMRLNVQNVDLPAVINASLESVRPAADAKHIQVRAILDPEAGPVKGDPDRLQQVVWNLLSNAIKYTPKNGHVQVHLQRVNSHVEIVVSDTGQGVDPAFLPSLFDRFSQADASTTRSHGGLGLGLAIVRHLVELHGGSVRANSLGLGRGTTFTIDLPLSFMFDERSPQDAAHPTAPPSSDASPTADGRIDLSGIEVLVVDDEEDARSLLKQLLERNGASVTTAASADEAMQRLAHEQPTILLSDIGMPEKDGYQLLAEVRKLPPGKGGDIPAVALTAFARSEDRRRALMAGFQLHVPKPVEREELLTVVASVARSRRPA